MMTMIDVWMCENYWDMSIWGVGCGDSGEGIGWGLG